jgi:outer membrane lipoprotein SlyB
MVGAEVGDWDETVHGDEVVAKVGDWDGAVLGDWVGAEVGDGTGQVLVMLGWSRGRRLGRGRAR